MKCAATEHSFGWSDALQRVSRWAELATRPIQSAFSHLSIQKAWPADTRASLTF
jgi:hypothetical protein